MSTPDPFEFPEFPATQRAEAELVLRYEDAVQDGRLVLSALAFVQGEVVWRRAVANHPAEKDMRREGIVPILVRLHARGTDAPVSIGKPVQGVGGYRLAHTRDAQGAVERIVSQQFVTVSAPRARLIGPKPERPGELDVAGMLVTENVFTRLFAPAAERKVTRLPGPHMPEVPGEQLAWRPLEAALELPTGASWLEETFGVESRVAFSLGHTDANQHVNSLVYTRLFEEAAVRRLAALGEGAAWLLRELEIGYRKPCFAGDVVAVVLRVYAAGARRGVAGAFVALTVATGPMGPDALVQSRPFAYVRAEFAK